jgi:DNA-binding response OmpR family regulator
MSEVRDMNRLVLAEDDIEVAQELRQVLEGLGGYEVWVTRFSTEVISLLTKTNAMWLVLDLNLEDGYSGDRIATVRRMWGNEVYIIVLSGYYSRYPEHELLGKGADTFLRKPYAPKALISLISRARVRLDQGVDLEPSNGFGLKVGDGVVDLDRGVYVKDDSREEIFLTDLQQQLLLVLASARIGDDWAFLDRAHVLLQLWAEDYAGAASVFANRLRQLKSRTTSTLGVDPIEIHRSGRSTKWRLTPAVVELMSPASGEARG